MQSDHVQQANEILEQAHSKHGGRLIYPCSFGSEGMVLVDLICRRDLVIRIMTLDTGRLPQATYDLMDEVRKRYDIELEVFFPDAAEVEKMVREHGVNLFFESVENRKLCCEIRKVHPLKRALHGMEAWITGRRRDQSSHRTAMQAVEDDPVYGLKKYNPLLEWTEADVWEYIRTYDVPYSRLHDEHYVSIGCECCTRAIAVGEDPRAGRWWWEQSEAVNECGLHASPLKSPQDEGESGKGV